jgi:hypothetical protein
MTVRAMDPTQPFDPRVSCLRSADDAAAYWTVSTEELARDRRSSSGWGQTSTIFSRTQCSFGVVNIAPAQPDGLTDKYNIVALAYLLEVISRARGHGGNGLVAAVRVHSAVVPHDRLVTWDMPAHCVAGGARVFNGLPVSDHVVVYIGEQTYGHFEYCRKQLDAVLSAMKGTDAQYIIVFLDACYETMCQLVASRPWAFAADVDGRFSPDVLKGDDQKCLVVGIGSQWDNAESNAAKLYALTQADAAWRFLHCLSPHNIGRIPSAVAADIAGNPDFPVSLLGLVQGYVGEPVDEIVDAQDKDRRLGQEAKANENDLMKLLERLSLKRPRVDGGSNAKQPRVPPFAAPHRSNPQRRPGSAWGSAPVSSDD